LILTLTMINSCKIAHILKGDLMLRHSILITLLFLPCVLHAMNNESKHNIRQIAIITALINPNTTETFFSHHAYYTKTEKFDVYKQFNDDLNNPVPKIYTNSDTITSLWTWHSVKTYFDTFDYSNRIAILTYDLKTLVNIMTLTTHQIPMRFCKPEIRYNFKEFTIKKTVALSPDGISSFECTIPSYPCGYGITTDPITLMITGHAYNTPPYSKTKFLD